MLFGVGLTKVMCLLTQQTAKKSWLVVIYRTTHIEVLTKVNNVTNNVANTTATNNFNKEDQEYHSQRDQQYIGCKYDGGLEQVIIIELVLKEEKQMMMRIRL